MTGPEILAEIRATAGTVRADALTLELERRRLRALIRRARAAGVKVDAIGRAAGVSRQRISQLTERGV